MNTQTQTQATERIAMRAKELRVGDKFWTEARYNDEFGPGRAGTVTKVTTKKVTFSTKSGKLEVEDSIAPNVKVVKA